jgi:hypothetical protein
MRWLLLKVDDELRSQILWEAQKWSKENEAEAAEGWASQLTEFLQKVWPRQIAAKSPAISARLVELAFSDKARFAQRVEAILPLLTKLDRGAHLSLLDLNETSNNVIDSYPKQALALLHIVLPDDARAWPYGIEAVIRRIGEADASLNADERLTALKRRWDAR